MHIASIELKNWLPYRGVHRLDLEARAYGVVARAVGQPEASNWKGKTSLLSAVRFALYGSHPARYEDDWITRGEGEGSVVLTLSDGLVVERRRSRGQSTGLIVRGAGRDALPREAMLAREPAQELIERWIGLSERDFFATSFFEQKRMHRFVTARPAERFADVAAWVRLGPLRRAEEETRKKLAALGEREARLSSNAALLRSRIAEAGDSASLKVRTIEAADALRGAEENVRQLEVAADDERERRSLRDAAREHEALKRELDGLVVPPAGPIVRRDDAAFAAMHEAISKTKRLRVLSRGEFAGACPVAPIECPAKDRINARSAEATSELREAERAEASAIAARDRSVSVEEEARRADRRRAEAETRAGFLKRRIAETAPAARRLAELPPEGPSAGAEEALRLVARPALQEAATAAARATTTLRQAERDAAELAKIEAELRAAGDEAATLREAAAILGRKGAQRRIARGAVDAIEAGANGRLVAAGIDLSVRLTWGRETDDLASACDACGEPFPAGRSAKVCRCGAERGPKVVDELGCELSSVSGAAEDLAGIALSLSAAAWIRSDRTSGWGVALLDEPFGSLDAPNRRALASALSSMLSPAGGWEQALVVAHHEGVMDALPGRIQIVAGPHGSWARVA